MQLVPLMFVIAGFFRRSFLLQMDGVQFVVAHGNVLLEKFLPRDKIFAR